MPGRKQHNLRPQQKQRAATVKSLSREIDSTLQMLQEYQSTNDKSLPSDSTAAVGLLDQCMALCAEQYALREEPIRTVHHFACTGGTLFSKCIAAMPNTQLLSEIDPLSKLTTNQERPNFSATDLIGQIRQGTRHFDDTMLVEVFLRGIEALLADAEKKGLRLVIRDHAHSQFCTAQDASSRPTLREILQQQHQVLSVITVRHPIDSYASLLKHGWIHFHPESFDEYCARYLAFLHRYENVPIYKYEDFVHEPPRVMQDLCAALKLPYQEQFESLYSIFKLTGDSGRTSTNIAARVRQGVSDALLVEVNESRHYKKLAEWLRYDYPVDA